MNKRQSNQSKYGGTAREGVGSARARGSEEREEFEQLENADPFDDPDDQSDDIDTLIDDTVGTRARMSSF